MCSLQDTCKDSKTNRLKRQGQKATCHVNKVDLEWLYQYQKEKQKQLLDFKSKIVNRDREKHFQMGKGSIHQKDITIINTNEPNNEYMKQ